MLFFFCCRLYSFAVGCRLYSFAWMVVYNKIYDQRASMVVFCLIGDDSFSSTSESYGWYVFDVIGLVTTLHTGKVVLPVFAFSFTLRLSNLAVCVVAETRKGLLKEKLWRWNCICGCGIHWVLEQEGDAFW